MGASSDIVSWCLERERVRRPLVQQFLVSQFSSFLVRQFTSSLVRQFSSQLFVRESERDFCKLFNAVNSGSTSSSVLPLVYRPLFVFIRSSSPVFLLVYSPSSVVNRLLFAVRLPSSSVRHPTMLHHRSTTTSTQRFAHQPGSREFIICRAASCATCCRLLV